MNANTNKYLTALLLLCPLLLLNLLCKKPECNLEKLPEPNPIQGLWKVDLQKTLTLNPGCKKCTPEYISETCGNIRYMIDQKQIIERNGCGLDVYTYKACKFAKSNLYVTATDTRGRKSKMQFKLNSANSIELLTKKKGELNLSFYRDTSRAKDQPLLKELAHSFYRDIYGSMYLKTDYLAGADEAIPFWREIPRIDLDSYQELGEAVYYRKDKHRVYYGQATTTGEFINVLEGADPKTFKVFGYRWGKDRFAVYHNGIKLEGLNPARMVILPGQHKSRFDYVRDDRKVFRGFDEVEGANPRTFRVEE